MGSSQLSKVDNLIRKKQSIAKKYNKHFKKIENITIPPTRENCYHAYHLYPLLIDFKKMNLNKSTFMNYFLKIILDYRYITNQYIHINYIKNYLDLKIMTFLFL